MNIFLTGASSGIGQALAKEFAANGATLGLVARREDKLKELIAELPNPELHTAIVCDVTDRDRLIEEARKFDEACGGVDIAVACAGISVGVKTQYREDLDVFDKVFDTNVFAMASTFHAFIDPMIKRKRGTLVFAVFREAKLIAPANPPRSRTAKAFVLKCRNTASKS